MQSKYLYLLFETLNNLLFRGRIPEIPIFRKKIDAKYAGFYFYKNKEPLSIVIGSWVPIEQSLQVLVHEMVHAYCHLVLKDRSKLEHSPSFVKVLTRVYKKLGFPPPSIEEITNG